MAKAGSTGRTDTEELVPFLTAWDPSDLPGGSVDPLGFDRAYNWLSEKILPGLTNVASNPRYFGLLCAGASLGPESVSPTRAEIAERQAVLLRLERFWALANVLAAEAGGPPAEGIRGITYAETQRAELARLQARSSPSDFTLLTRQVQYGVLGIYGNVAHGMKLIDRKTLGLPCEHGERLGEAFLAETQAPGTLMQAAKDAEREVGIDALRDWGARAHVGAIPGRDERRALGQALRLDRVRARMAEALARYPLKDDESELGRLGRIAEKLGKAHVDLVEGILAIIAFERCYALAVLAFDRILWSCGASGSVTVTELARDDVVVKVARGIKAMVGRLDRQIEGAETLEFKKELERIADIRAFLTRLGRASDDPSELVEATIARHVDVQRGKFDRGRRKLPWLEAQDGVVTLTLARANQIAGEPRNADDVVPHEYRTASADALVAAEAGVAHG